MKTYSLRTSSLVSFILPLVLTVSVMVAAALWASYSEISTLNDSQMAQFANTLNVLTRHEALEGEDIDRTLGSKTDQAQSLAGSMTAYRIWSAEGLVTQSPNARDFGAKPTHPGFSTVADGGRSWRVYLLRDAQNNIDIEVAQDMSARWSLLRGIGVGLLLPALALIPALLLIIVLSVGRAFSPLMALSRTLDQRDSNNLSPVQIGRIPVEILPVHDALNKLLSRVRDGLQHEREFTDNAAHELRTPLAALKARAQVMSREIAPRSALRAGMDELLAIIDRSAGLVEQMLTAARLHHAPDAGQTTDFSTLVSGQVAALAEATRLKGQSLTTEITPGITVTGDNFALGVLVRNLVDNAIRYTPSSGEIAVRLLRDGQHAVLHVADTGPGIPLADRRRVLERFTRLTNTETGSGLGLSIVNWVCKMHGADLTLSDNPPHGLLVTVSMKAT